MSKKQLKGVVVSDKMQKTVVVEVERIKQHPKYLKRYKVHKRYKAHDEKEECKIGNKVVIEECRPLSRDKRWRVIKKALKSEARNPKSETSTNDQNSNPKGEPTVPHGAGDQKTLVKVLPAPNSNSKNL